MKTLIIILATLTFALNSCKTNNEEANLATAFSMSDTMLAKCDFYVAEFKEVKNELRLFGKIEPDNNKLAQVYSIVGGNVIKINVELGDHVDRGQVLAIVRSSEVAEFKGLRVIKLCL